MKRFATVVSCLAMAVSLGVPAYAQLGEGGQSGPVDLVRPPVRDLDPVDPLPRPIAPTVTFRSDEMQLVGFTRVHVAGNEGVLNMSIACQREFRASRMCTVNEVNRSLYIPEALGGGYAWVQSVASDAVDPQLNCHGWMSSSVEHHGTSIELGECYGGMAMTTCNSRLAVACCALEGPTALR